MELAQYQMQIFISLVVILGAAFVALICDLLKGNNEQLRELALELKVRREEEHRRFQILAPRILAEAAAGAPASAAPTPVQAAVSHKVRAEEEKAPEAAERKHKRQRDPQRRAPAPEALAAIERGIELAASPRARRTAMPVPFPEVASESVPQPAAEPEVHQTHAVRPVEPVAVPPAELEPMVEILQPASSAGVPAPSARTRDWSQLLSVRHSPVAAPVRKEARKAAEPTGLLDAVMAATASNASAAAEPSLPAGFQDGFVLTRLVESRQPVSGLVVSIGAAAQQNNALRNEDPAISANVRTLIRSLLGPGDFAAQSGSDEFLLIYPGERGAQAQRKLSQIAEQLWDFQLRSMGSLSIQFSWGGVEVRSESIDEAIASATERMQETRRSRKVLTMEQRTGNEAPLRRAV